MEAINRWQDRDADALADIYAQKYEINRLILEQYRDSNMVGSLPAPTHTEAMRAIANLTELAELLEGVSEGETGGQIYNVIINNYGQAVNKETGFLDEDWSKLDAEILTDGNASAQD